MCSFTAKNQSVSGVTTICLTKCNTSPSHRVDQIVDCGLWNVGPLLFNGCVKLLDIGRNWNTLSYTTIQSIPNMLNGWHVRWVCWPCKNWDVFSFQELCTEHKSVTMTNSSQVETPMRMTSMQMSFPETVSDSLCRNYLVMLTDRCSSCLSDLSQKILEVKMLDAEVLGWCGYTLWGMYCQILWNAFGDGLW